MNKNYDLIKLRNIYLKNILLKNYIKFTNFKKCAYFNALKQNFKNFKNINKKNENDLVLLELGNDMLRKNLFNNLFNSLNLKKYVCFQRLKFDNMRYNKLKNNQRALIII